MINCGIYPRKSKRADNSDSMDLQIDMGIRYLNDKYGSGNYNLTIYDGDYALTGHSTAKRKDFQRMMNDVRSGKINLVVIMRYDRIARNMRDFCNLYHDMEEAGCNLVSISQQIDTSTPYGKNFMYQMAAMAELEWAIISERYKDTAKYKREHGYAYTGRVPYGYKIELQADGHKRVVKDPEHDAKIVFDFYKKHKSKMETVRFVKENYKENFTYDMLRKMFETEMYLGKVNGNSNFCEKYLTEEEWKEIKNVKVCKFTPSNRIYLFAGLVKCPYCGNSMVSTTTGQNHLQYYRCGYYNHERIHDGILVRESIIEESLLMHLEPILDKKISDVNISSNYRIKSANKQISNLEKQKERLNYMFEKGRIDIEQYEKKFSELEKLIEGYTPKKEVDYESIKGKLTSDWKDMYKSLDANHKKVFWHNIIRNIIINEQKEIVDLDFCN